MTCNARSRRRYGDFWLGFTSGPVAQALREHAQAVIAAKVSRNSVESRPGCVVSTGRKDVTKMREQRLSTRPR